MREYVKWRKTGSTVVQDRQGESDGALMLTATDRPHSAVWCALHSRHLLPSLPSAALLVSGSVTLRPLKLPCQYLHVKKICSSSQIELLASIQVEVLMSTLGQLWHKVRNQTQGPMNSKDWKHIYNICYVSTVFKGIQLQINITSSKEISNGSGDGKNVMAGIYNMKLRHWSCDFLTPCT